MTMMKKISSSHIVLRDELWIDDNVLITTWFEGSVHAQRIVRRRITTTVCVLCCAVLCCAVLGEDQVILLCLLLPSFCIREQRIQRFKYWFNGSFVFDNYLYIQRESYAILCYFCLFSRFVSSFCWTKSGQQDKTYFCESINLPVV